MKFESTVTSRGGRLAGHDGLGRWQTRPCLEGVQVGTTAAQTGSLGRPGLGTTGSKHGESAAHGSSAASAWLLLLPRASCRLTLAGSRWTCVVAERSMIREFSEPLHKWCILQEIPECNSCWCLACCVQRVSLNERSAAKPLTAESDQRKILILHASHIRI